MAQQAITEPKSLTSREIKEFGSTSGPAITLILPAGPLPGVKRKLSTHFKASLATVRQKLADRGVAADRVTRILAPLEELREHVDEVSDGNTLVVLRSEEEFRHYWLEQSLSETIIVAGNFYIRPFLNHVDGERRFYLLALSQKDIRLLRYTEHSTEEVDLANRVPRNLVEFTANDVPDHTLENRSTGAPAVGAGGAKGVVFGTAADRENKDEYLLHFYKAVNDGVVGLLRNLESTPMVLAGVDYELAQYRRVNTYPHTCEEGVHGAANGLRGGEMHARALECLRHADEKELEAVLAQHEKQAGEVAKAGIDSIVRLAYDGRVQHLLIAENANAVGRFDETTYQAEIHVSPEENDEDLINAAAIRTIANGGRVHLLPQERMPENRPLACIVRY